MSRHSKNNTAHSIFTYWERKKVKDAGTLKERLSSDSLRQFEQCWLCLRTATKPVCTPLGYVFCHRCIILNFGEQKKEIEEQTAVWDAHLNRKAKEESVKNKLEKKSVLQRFVDQEDKAVIFDSNIRQSRKRGRSESDRKPEEQFVYKENQSKWKEEMRAKNFWIKENTPSANSTNPIQANKSLVCPITKTPLKLKDLVKLNPKIFTSKEADKWVCSVSHKIISHQNAVAVKQTGQIVLKEVANKYLLGETLDNNHVIKDCDLIPLVAGGTGFASHNKVEAQKFRPVME